MNADQIKHMVDRFLVWRLPADFRPDGGISYAKMDYHAILGPTGTNLLDATQADAMVRHMVEGLPAVNSHPSTIREAVEGAKREERESCAKLLERLVPDRHSYVNGYDAAVAIRARGE